MLVVSQGFYFLLMKAQGSLEVCDSLLHLLYGIVFVDVLLDEFVDDALEVCFVYDVLLLTMVFFVLLGYLLSGLGAAETASATVGDDFSNYILYCLILFHYKYYCIENRLDIFSYFIK